MTDNETVEIRRDTLMRLIEEAEMTVEAIDDPEWHELSETDGVKDAIEEARAAL